MKRMKKTLTYICILALVVGAFSYVPTTGAAKKPGLSKKKVTIPVGKTVKIKVKNAKKGSKIRWKSNRRSVAKIEKKRSKGKKNLARIRGVREGKAVITAVYRYEDSKKKLKCRVTVVSAADIPQAEATVMTTATAVPAGTDKPYNEVTEAPVTEVPTTDTPATETPATDTPTTDTPATEEPETPATDAPESTDPPKITETPKPANEPTATPAVTEDVKVQLDLDEASVLGGIGTVSCDDNGVITANSVDGVLIPIDGAYEAGDVIRVTVNGSASADVRLWISDRDGWTELSNQISPMTFGQSYELTLTGASAECAVQIKKISYSSSAIDTVTVSEVTVELPAPTPTPVPAPTSTPLPGEESYTWVTTWGTAEEKCDITADAMPKMALAGTTVRQIAKLTTGGNRLKLRLSNQYGTSDVSIVSLHIAKQVKADESTIDTSTDTIVTVGGNESFVIPKGKVIETDPINISVNALDNVAISAYFGQAPSSNITGHRGARATTYQMSGNHVSTETFTSYQTTTSWFFLADIAMWSEQGSKAVVCFGDSITDGYGTDASYLGKKPDSYTRWVDYFAKRLQADESTRHISVINEGIGANSMLGSYPTDAGKDRFERDLLEHDGVGYCIILFGVNDLNCLSNTSKYSQLLPEYQKMVKLCHDNGIKVYGAPILPFGTSSYYSEASEQVRTMINNWMRSTDSQMDGIIDFESAVADPANPKNILEAYTHDDGLHPYDGYEVMANAIDLTMFK